MGLKKMAVVVLVAMLAMTASAAGGAWAATRFIDVPDSHPFAADIAWMADTGITEGYDDGTFRTGAPVSRQAMAAFLHRFAGAFHSTEITVTVWPDDVIDSQGFLKEDATVVAHCPNGGQAFNAGEVHNTLTKGRPDGRLWRWDVNPTGTLDLWLPLLENEPGHVSTWLICGP